MVYLKAYRNQLVFLGVSSLFLSTFCFYLYAKYKAELLGPQNTKTVTNSQSYFNETVYNQTLYEIELFKSDMSQSLQNLENGFVSNDSYFQGKWDSDAKEIQLREESIKMLNDSKYLSFIETSYIQQLGNWSSDSLFEIGMDHELTSFTRNKGKVHLKIKPSLTKNTHAFELLIYDGEYIDDLIIALSTSEASFDPVSESLLLNQTKTRLILSQAFSPIILGGTQPFFPLLIAKGIDGTRVLLQWLHPVQQPEQLLQEKDQCVSELHRELHTIRFQCRIVD